MAATKTLFAPTVHCLRYFFIFSAILTSAYATELEWKSLTSFNDVRHMRLINDTLFIATSGGLLVNDYDNTSSPGSAFTNVDGLGTVDITDIIVDSAGQKWVTGKGRLLRFDYGTILPYLFFDQNNNLIKLHTAADVGDYLWVGTEIGLVLFSKIDDGGQIQDSYTLFDSLNPSPQVFDICLDGDTIWLATSAGLARADKSNPISLKSPSSWKTYDRIRYPELGSDNFTGIVKFENTFYAGTSSGLYNLDRTAIDTFLIMPLGPTSPFSEIKVANDSLFFYSSGAYGVIKNAVTTALSFTGLPVRPESGITNGVFRWANVRNTGIYQNSGGTFQVYPHSGMPLNATTDLTVDKQGNYTVGFQDGFGGRFQNNQWSKYKLGDFCTLAELDSSGNAWLGTFGNGIWRFDSGAPVKYDENNTTMRGNT
ncbi:MAG: hypothetical protein ACREBV_08505, partial [Candidatus Zixiibacteriota bacterium]